MDAPATASASIYGFGSNTIEWASGERVPLAEVRAWTDSNLPVAAAKEEEGFIVL